MIYSATRIPAPKFKRQRNTPMQRAGLKYQRDLTRALKQSAPTGLVVEPTPWFSYSDKRAQDGRALICSPDILLVDQENEFVVVIEVKTTYTPTALDKLQKVYCPVVSRALKLPCRPLVICKNLTPDAPLPSSTLLYALRRDQPLFSWLGQGPIQW